MVVELVRMFYIVLTGGLHMRSEIKPLVASVPALFYDLEQW